jgi:DNA-binding GntR family transcriptional regulator
VPAKLLSADVYESIRTDILAGRREPGSRIKIAAVAAQFSVSLSVVREALSRLDQHGLVSAEPNQGFSVIALSRADLVDLTWTRVQVEGLAIYESVDRADVGWEGSVIAAHHVLERAEMVAATDPNRVLDPWAQAHAAYHNRLLEGCGRPRLIEIAETLRDAAELYRRWSVPFATGRKRDIAKEHHGILQAVLSRDSTEARRMLVAHIEETTNVLLSLPEPA